MARGRAPVADALPLEWRPQGSGHRTRAAEVGSVPRRRLPARPLGPRPPATAQTVRDAIAVLEARAVGKPDELRERELMLAWHQTGLCAYYRGFNRFEPLTEEDCRRILTGPGFRRWDDNEDVLRTHDLELSDRRRIHYGCQAVPSLLRSLIRDSLCVNDFSGYVYAALAVGGFEAQAELGVQCAIIRDVFGNPFRKPKFDRRWRTDTALSLARQMYESRDFSAMPILADALQDAGCDNADILDHCRDRPRCRTPPIMSACRQVGIPTDRVGSPAGLHSRGCWVVDLVLGKA